MSREIKFRAWDKEDKKMWKVVSITESVWGNCEEAHIRVCEFHENPSKKETDVRMSVEYELMQYTGLKDKNGREIYEGDILLFNNSHNDRNNKWVCVVEYRDGSFVCEYLKDEVYNHFDAWNVPKVTWEVIGNIYENPELLEATA